MSRFRRRRDGDSGPGSGPESALAYQQRFERIVEIAVDAIISADVEQRIVLFNTGAEEIFGYRREEVLGRPLGLLLPERFREAHGAHLRQFAEGDVVARRMGERREISGLRKDGHEFPAEASISRLQTPQGPLFTVVLRDITERKKAEETQRFLADASAVLARSLDYETTLAGLARIALPRLADWCAIDALDESHGGLRRIQVAHKDAQREEEVRGLLAYPPGPDRPDPALTVVDTGETELLESVSEEMLRAMAVDPAHHDLLQSLGARSLLVVPLIARSRILGAFTLVSSDPTRHYGPDDRMLAEELARRAALAVDNARLYRESREAVAARDEVLSVVSHDLGNPLSAILVSTRVVARLLDSGSTEPARLHLDGIREAAAQMERLIRDLLEIRRIEAGRLRLLHRPETVAALVERALTGMLPLAEERGLTLESRIEPEADGIIEVDADRIQQVFSNLIGNALKFTPEGGTVRIVVSARDRARVFAVEDTGPGIPADELPHVFDRFWQARRQRSHGVGLGLAIARGLVEAHGGQIEAESVPGSGSRFRFILPLSPY